MYFGDASAELDGVELSFPMLYRMYTNWTFSINQKILLYM